MEINCRFNPERGYFSMASGGDIAPEADFPVFSSKALPVEPKNVEQPGADVMQLIQRGTLEPKEYPAS